MLAWAGGELQSAAMLKPDIRRLQAGDSQMWDAAYFSLWPIACSAVHRRLGILFPGDLEDVAISAISQAAEQVDGLASFDELLALTAVIANRRALDHIRRRQAERRAAGATESLEGRDDLASSEPGPLEKVNARDLAKLLTDLAKTLPRIDRQLLLAYYFEGRKQAELAEQFVEHRMRPAAADPFGVLPFDDDRHGLRGGVGHWLSLKSN